MFEDDKPRRLAAFHPLSVLSNDRLIGVLWIISDSPITSVLIPNDGFETEYSGGDGSYSVVDITVRWSPKTRDLPSGSFIYDLHGISQLGQDLLIRQRRHIRMRPGMNSDVTALIERVLEVWFVPVNVTANHEVGRGDVVFGEVRV